MESLGNMADTEKSGFSGFLRLATNYHFLPLIFPLTDQMCPEDYQNNSGDCQASFNDTSHSYDDANSHCKMLSGGTLAAIKDMDQWDSLTNELE